MVLIRYEVSTDIKMYGSFRPCIQVKMYIDDTVTINVVKTMSYCYNCSWMNLHVEIAFTIKK